jgi:hypothetical protein
MNDARSVKCHRGAAGLGLGQLQALDLATSTSTIECPDR